MLLCRNILWLLLACMSTVGLSASTWIHRKRRGNHVTIHIHHYASKSKPSKRSNYGKGRYQKQKSYTRKPSKSYYKWQEKPSREQLPPLQWPPVTQPIIIQPITRPIIHEPITRPIIIHEPVTQPVTQPVDWPATQQLAERERLIQDLKGQLASSTEHIQELSDRYKQATLKAGEAEFLAKQLIALSRRLDEANLALAAGQSSPKLTEEFRLLNQQISDLTYELSVAKKEALSQALKFQGHDQDLIDLKTAVAAYILSDEKLQQSYGTYQQLFESYMNSPEEAIIEAKNQLFVSWQEYVTAIHTLNKVLRRVGLFDRLVSINPSYEIMVRGAIGSIIDQSLSEE